VKVQLLSPQSSFVLSVLGFVLGFDTAIRRWKTWRRELRISLLVPTHQVHVHVLHDLGLSGSLPVLPRVEGDGAEAREGIRDVVYPINLFKISP